jgi:hypothetical protein
VSHGSSQPFMVPLNAVYNNVTVQGGAYMSANGTTLAFYAYGTVTVAGVITMDGHGYAGGTVGSTEGDSYTGAGQHTWLANGGGGGGGWSGSGGGGGGYGTPGSPGGKAYPDATSSAEGGGTYGDSSLSTLYPGSGGGCSELNPSSFGPAVGGAGGGIIHITSASIIVTGSISANGAGGKTSPTEGTQTYNIGGGGGSGGSVLLVAGSLTGSGNVTVSGGAGGYGYSSSGRDISGGHGGDGRFRFLHS